MGFFDFLIQPNINQAIKEYESSSDGFLLDVRTVEEYQEGHIPRSQNIPLDSLDKIKYIVKNKNAPIFAYCHSGARSSQAVNLLKRMGYSNVTNMGGIAAYSGKVER